MKKERTHQEEDSLYCSFVPLRPELGRLPRLWQRGGGGNSLRPMNHWRRILIVLNKDGISLVLLTQDRYELGWPPAREPACQRASEIRPQWNRLLKQIAFVGSRFEFTQKASQNVPMLCSETRIFFLETSFFLTCLGFRVSTDKLFV